MRRGGKWEGGEERRQEKNRTREKGQKEKVGKVTGQWLLSLMKTTEKY